MTDNRKLPDGYGVADASWRDLTKDQQQTVLKILGDGKAVDVASAKVELPHVTALVLLRHHDAIVGVGTIKPERVWYAKDVQSAKKSGHPFDPKTLELGYVVVAQDHQDKKLSSHIADALLAGHKGALFATTDKEKMKSALGHRGFVQHGNEWKGRNGTKLSLWLRES
ncbi:MAG: hypothetical protein KGJ78_15995 [Alphaproteobacteria bacterium]|nr:hypothetical protein [Alphaproteobacteria bacterium]